MSVGRSTVPEVTSLPTWAIYAVSFGSPLAAFLGVAIGHALTRRGATELDRRAKREETMRTLRWASELAVTSDGRTLQLGIAALDALSASPWLQSEDQVFIDAVLAAVLSENAEAYRAYDRDSGVDIVLAEAHDGSEQLRPADEVDPAGSSEEGM